VKQKNVVDGGITFISPEDSWLLVNQDDDVYGITTNGNFMWVAHSGWFKLGTIYKYNMDGTYTGENFDTSFRMVGGITTNGNNFWIVNREDGMVYKYNMDGTYTGESFDSNLWNARGITTNNDFIWISNLEERTIHKYNMDGTYTGENFYVSGRNPLGITTDGEYIWIVDDIKIIKHDINGVYVKFKYIFDEITDPWGIAIYDNSLFVSNNERDHEVYKYSSLWGEEGCDYGYDCIDGICVLGPTEAYWADMNEERIENTNLNDMVQLRVVGVSMENIHYEIWKTVRFWFDDKVAETSTNDFITWRAGDDGSGNLEGGEYYFKAESDGESAESGTLDVSGLQDNSPPVVNIAGPETGDIFYIGEEMDFTLTVSDEDDDVTFFCDLGDGTKKTENSFTYSYGKEEQKIIKLTATDSRGLSTTDRISILIINPSGTEYVFAHIDNPEWGENLFDDDARVVSFDASSSYAVETTDCGGTIGSCTINCLAGDCHSETHDGGQPVENEENLRGNYAPLNFSWTFQDGSKKQAKGSEGVSFDWIFRVAGKNKAWLKVSKNPFSLTDVEFNSFFEYPSCYRDSATGDTFWYEGGSILLSMNNCYRDPSQTPQPTTDCCPSGYLCDSVSGVCNELDGIPSCGQYTEYGQQTCEANIFPAEDALNPILETEDLICGGSREYGTECWEIIDCKCGWKNDECLSVVEQIVCDTVTCWNKDELPADIETICNAVGLPFSGECSFKFDLLDKCETEGWIERTWDAIWDFSVVTQGELKPAYCEDGSDQINCKMTKLTFFTIVSLIITILVMFILFLGFMKLILILFLEP